MPNGRLISNLGTTLAFMTVAWDGLKTNKIDWSGKDKRGRIQSLETSIWPRKADPIRISTWLYIWYPILMTMSDGARPMRSISLVLTTKSFTQTCDKFSTRFFSNYRWTKIVLSHMWRWNTSTCGTRDWANPKRMKSRSLLRVGSLRLLRAAGSPMTRLAPTMRTSSCKCTSAISSSRKNSELSHA